MPGEVEVIRATPIELGRCRAAECQRRIEWVTTTKGKRMPVDAPLVVLRQHERLDGSMIVVVASATSHFATCPAAKTFRRKQGR